MEVGMRFGSGRVEFEAPDDRIAGHFDGPPGVFADEARRLVAEALEAPEGAPSLRQMLVSGDRVAIALDPRAPEVSATLSAICEVLLSSGVEADAIKVVADSAPPPGWDDGLPTGVELIRHDTTDRDAVAYLASTPEGRRVYLNRHVVEADAVVALGRLGFDFGPGLRGPWDAIDPALGDVAARVEARSRALAGIEGLGSARAVRPDLGGDTEVGAVGWLLGNPFQVGLVEGATGGIATVVGGAEAEVRAASARVLERDWTYPLAGRVDLVVAGVGRPELASTWDDVARALSTCLPLLRSGGRLALLTELSERPGPAVGRLLGLDGPKEMAKAARRGVESPDHLAALLLARALVETRVYLHSRLPDDLIEDLQCVPLSRPEEARRLAADAGSILFVDRAECARIEVGDGDDG